ncbi:LysE family translocator [Shewanella sp. VB17]|uniref:LysE family translocator n=1 Tax=Shewanella sp. VB17 TaxID=2739432 RepID=UPI001567AA5D|nr:LysE family translocator [Shewanella sp. VB17]NRD73126.1 LysE family translocator [Shewanella sp. VB17]
MDSVNLLVFLTASLAINAVPGADVVYVVSTYKHSGIKAANLCIIGLFLGYLFHVLITYIGISKVIASNEILFNGIKYLGSGYLIYLGIKMIHETYKSKKTIKGDSGKKDTGTIHITNNKHSYIAKGFLISALNPKVSLFFLSFIPQFIDSSDTDSMLTIVLGLIFCIGATFFNFFYCYISKVKLNIKFEVVKYIPGFVLTSLGVYTAI